MATGCWRCTTRSSTATSQTSRTSTRRRLSACTPPLRTWMLGYPDRAVQVSDANDAHARRRGHPFDLGWALTVGGPLWDFRCEPEPLLARVEEAERLGRAHNLPFISEVLAQVFKGLAWLRAGRLAEGIPHLRGALERWNPHGGGFWMPYFRAVLAEGLALSGDLEGGLQSDRRQSHADCAAGLGRTFAPCRGPAAQRLDALSSKATSKARSRTISPRSTGHASSRRSPGSYARRPASRDLWQSQGKRKEAYDLLAPIYDWFTEGLTRRTCKRPQHCLRSWASEGTTASAKGLRIGLRSLKIPLRSAAVSRAATFHEDVHSRAWRQACQVTITNPPTLLTPDVLGGESQERSPPTNFPFHSHVACHLRPPPRSLRPAGGTCVSACSKPVAGSPPSIPRSRSPRPGRANCARRTSRPSIGCASATMRNAASRFSTWSGRRSRPDRRQPTSAPSASSFATRRSGAGSRAASIRPELSRPRAQSKR